jgi:cysteine desulfurase
MCLDQSAVLAPNDEVIYWDNNATTRPADEVVEAMLPFLRDAYMNPSSGYAAARRVREAIEQARAQVASLMGCDPAEITFTSGATESINTVFRGLTQSTSGPRPFMAVSTDHDASLHTLQALGARSLALPVLCPVDAEGLVNIGAWETSLRDSLCGASFTWANNETGVIQPASDLVRLAHEAGVPVHVDGVQALGKIPVNLHELGADYASFSAHKLYGPKGIGALYVRTGCRHPVLLFGGGQETDLRSGTENVAGIVGFGVAAQLAETQLNEQAKRLSALRDRMERELTAALPDLRILSSGASRVPNTSNIAFSGCTAEALMLLLEPKGLLCSAGSACQTASPRPSHVLTAMGLSDKEARSCLRFSLSTATTEEEVDEGIRLIIEAVKKVRSVQSSKTGPVIIYRPSAD